MLEFPQRLCSLVLLLQYTEACGKTPGLGPEAAPSGEGGLGFGTGVGGVVEDMGELGTWRSPLRLYAIPAGVCGKPEPAASKTGLKGQRFPPWGIFTGGKIGDQGAFPQNALSAGTHPSVCPTNREEGGSSVLITGTKH